MEYNENDLDLFETPDQLPQNVQDVINEFAEMSNTYDTCALLVNNLEALGYTCDYGLDGVPYGLRKINLEVSN